jgi:hypothetical protein
MDFFPELLSIVHDFSDGSLPLFNHYCHHVRVEGMSVPDASRDWNSRFPHWKCASPITYRRKAERYRDKMLEDIGDADAILHHFCECRRRGMKAEAAHRDWNKRHPSQTIPSASEYFVRARSRFDEIEAAFGDE